MNLTPRPATEEDLQALVEIETRVHLSPWTVDGFRSELTKPFGHLLVLTDDDTDAIIHGYISFWILDSQVRILNLAVDLPFRGLGLAKRLVRLAIQLALREGATLAGLEVRKSNLPAVQLYQQIGFAITQVRKGFYSNGEDAYQMELALEGERVEF